MLPSQASFCHPYQPYPIQLDFMTNLYRCIEEKKVGIFESPTGTGKSLSLICGALTWLRDHERRSLEDSTEDPDESDWLLQAEMVAQRRALMLEREELELKLAKIRDEEVRQRQKKADTRGLKKVRTVKGPHQEQTPDDAEFLVDEYESDQDGATTSSTSNSGFSSSTQALLDKLRKPTQKEAEEAEKDRLKIIFCSPDTFSVSLRLSQVEHAVHQMTAYALRFKQRLKGKNRVYVTQVIRLLNSLTDCLRDTIDKSHSQEVTVTAAHLMSGKGVDQIKPHKLLQYLHESKLCHKVEGYSDAQVGEDDTNTSKGTMMQFQNFLVVLMNPDDEGRFFVGRQDKDIVVRYTLLDPREHFRDIVQESRAVILAGGTMSPMSDYVDYLFSYLERSRLETFSFGHVIPVSHLFARAVGRGPSGIDFDFTYDKRGSEGMISELGQLIARICTVVPDGVVVFFPSYDYLAQVVSIWQKSLADRSIMERLAEKKTVFQESKGISVDELLRDYALAVDSGRGGLMLSVVGGKLSEGINFSDKLGRAVIAVGLPFPNANGAEWKAKMQHIEDVRYQQCKKESMKEGDCRSAAKSASKDFYENA
ncbi:ATP-dependent DNA helicase chl1, partial [Exophiala xenobiotica]